MRSFMWCSWFLLATLLGCTESCPDGMVFVEGSDVCRPDVPPDAGVMDAGAVVDSGSLEDAGMDAGGEPDAGPCGETCGGDTPACEASSGRCVECTVDDDAACEGSTPVCDGETNTCIQCDGDDASACSGETPLCDVDANACVACLDDADCTEAGAARCDPDTHACVGCDDSAQCTGITGTEVCDVEASTCVECTVDDESPCGDNSCDPASNACTSTPRGETRTCEACVADSECMADHRCVPMTFDGAENGSFCMRRASAGCARPFFSPLDARVSLSGAEAATYCGIDESTVSCQAVRALLDSRACPDGMASTCGAPGARCEMVGLALNQCTYACAGPSECLETGPASTCNSGYCGS